MDNHCEIGKVVEIDGQKVIVETINNFNDLTYFYNGVIYRGVTVGQFLGIVRGPYILVGRVEKEFLVDLFQNTEDITYNENRIKRNLQIKIIGYLEGNLFSLGIIAYPMIYNSVIMLSDDQIKSILINNKSKTKAFYIEIGETVTEKSEVKLDISTLFNTHIGIFGNTGSGKSNTLAKIYTELFKKDKQSLNLDNSKFVFIDFNGEYTGLNVFTQDKKVVKLSTRNKQSDKIIISKESFWDIETLSILFSATEKTQKPFLKNAINYFLDDDIKDISDDKIVEGICSAFYNTFRHPCNKESNKLLHKIYDELDILKTIGKVQIPYYDYLWHDYSKTYYLGNDYMYSKPKEEILEQRDKLESILNQNTKKTIQNLSITQKMKIAIYSHMIYCLSFGQIQYEYISPLIERLNSRVKIIDNLINICDEEEENKITVISLKNCNIEAKKLIPLLLAKNSYSKHKNQNEDNLENTFHLIIDEAHNILSTQSIREESSWKDYRLEVFEEIIKEGRKFGYYITLSSQRPSDISHTLISQLHNYFLHRLVSEQDLYMINNTINTLDSVSKSNIPILAPGQCIITGTSFQLPLIVQVEKLQKECAPNSDNADLELIWKIEDN